MMTDDQQHAGRDRVLQVGQHLADDLRLVLREGDLHRVRPGLLQLLDDGSSPPSTVSIRLAPVRFDTSMVMAGRPLTRVIEVASLKVGLISRDVAAASPWRSREAAIGIVQHVLRLSRSATAP